MKKLWTKFKTYLRLRKIEKAIGMHLTKQQRRIALNPSFPYSLYSMCGIDRRSGKTVTACVWSILHHRQPINWGHEFDIHMEIQQALQQVPFIRVLPSIPDPDARHSLSACRHMQSVYTNMVNQCLAHKIKIWGSN